MIDDWQSRGAGTLLLRRLIDNARTQGIARLVASVMLENRRAMRLARSAGARPVGWEGGGVIEYELIVE